MRGFSKVTLNDHFNWLRYIRVDLAVNRHKDKDDSAALRATRVARDGSAAVAGVAGADGGCAASLGAVGRRGHETTINGKLVPRTTLLTHQFRRSRRRSATTRRPADGSSPRRSALTRLQSRNTMQSTFQCWVVRREQDSDSTHAPILVNCTG